MGNAEMGYTKPSRKRCLAITGGGKSLAFKRRNEMTLFTTPMARQFVGFDSLFDELNKMAERKESNYPSYNIAKDDDEHYRIEVALAGFSSDDISIQTEKGVLTIEAKKEEAKGDTMEKYIHRGIAQRAISK